VRHLVQPTADRPAPADGAGLADERQESGLEGVLGILPVAEHSLADTEHHRSVPPDQHLERRLVALSSEALQKLCVGEAAVALPDHQTAQMPEDRTDFPFGHCLVPQLPATRIVARKREILSSSAEVSARFPGVHCRLLSREARLLYSRRAERIVQWAGENSL